MNRRDFVGFVAGLVLPGRNPLARSEPPIMFESDISAPIVKHPWVLPFIKDFLIS